MERIPLPGEKKKDSEQDSKKEADTEKIDKYFSKEFLDKVLPTSKK